MESEAPAADRRAAGLAAAALRRAGYTRDGLRDALVADGDVIARRGHRPVALRRLAGAGPLSVAARLFLLDDTVAPDEAERAVGTEALEAFATLRLVEERDGALGGSVRIVPQGDLLIASDLPRGGVGERQDHVAGVHRPPSRSPT